MKCPPAKEGGERSERALATVALAEVGGCSLVLHSKTGCNTKKQPPRAFGTSPPSQEGSLAFHAKGKYYRNEQPARNITDNCV